MRKSLYVRDDDYRLSFLYGNFTTLTRFTEADLERVLTEGLSPLFVSIHATDPEVRARMLRNRRGATSLRWLRALLDGGVEVHGQVVVCPDVNDGDVLEGTLAGILDEYPELASVACVPLGVSRFNKEAAMRPHSPVEAAATIDLVEEWQGIYTTCLGRRLAYAADEYYLLAGRPFPGLETYGAVAQHDNGVGMARAFEAAFAGGDGAEGSGPAGPSGFFRSLEGAPALGYRALRASGAVTLLPSRGAGTTVLTGEYGAPACSGRSCRKCGGTSKSWPCATSFLGATLPSRACLPAQTCRTHWLDCPLGVATSYRTAVCQGAGSWTGWRWKICHGRSCPFPQTGPPCAEPWSRPLTLLIPNEAGPIPNEAGPIPNEAGPIPNEAGPIPNEAGPIPNEIGVK